MFPLAIVAGWLQGHWWGFISRNYVVWPTFLLMNVFIALKGSHFWFLFEYSLFYCKFCTRHMKLILMGNVNCQDLNTWTHLVCCLQIGQAVIFWQQSRQHTICPHSMNTVLHEPSIHTLHWSSSSGRKLNFEFLIKCFKMYTQSFLLIFRAIINQNIKKSKQAHLYRYWVLSHFLYMYIGLCHQNHILKYWSRKMSQSTVKPTHWPVHTAKTPTSWCTMAVTTQTAPRKDSGNRSEDQYESWSESLLGSCHLEGFAMLWFKYLAW